MVKNMRKSCKNKPRARSKSKGRALGVALIAWAFMTVLSLPFLSSTVTYAREPEQLTVVNQSDGQLTKTPETREEVRAYILKEAKKAGVHVAKIMYIVEHESNFDPKVVGDLDIICNNPKSPYYKKPFYSRGVWQFSRCWYPHVTDEQAQSVEYSTKLALSIIANSKKDCKTQWTTCANWYKI